MRAGHDGNDALFIESDLWHDTELGICIGKRYAYNHHLSFYVGTFKIKKIQINV